MRSVTRIVTITALVVAVAMVLRNVDLTGSDASDTTGVIEAAALDATSLASNDLPSNAGTTATEPEDDSTRSSQIEVEDPRLAVVRDDHVAELEDEGEDDEPNPEPEPKPGVVPSEETHSNSNPAESESSSEVVQPVAVVRDDYVEEPEDEDDDDDPEPDPVESNNDESSSSNLTATLPPAATLRDELADAPEEDDVDPGPDPEPDPVVEPANDLTITPTPTLTPTDNDGTDSDGIDTPTPTDSDDTESDDASDSGLGDLGEDVAARSPSSSSNKARRRRRARTSPPVPLVPDIEFPKDPELTRLSKLFNSEWVWSACRDRIRRFDVDPSQIRVRYFSHTPGRVATVSYKATWRDRYIPEEMFTVRLHRNDRMELIQFPDDPYLAGLKTAAAPEGALRLVEQHVLPVPRRKMAVETVRYRPGNRAVLRHRAGKANFYVRVVCSGSLSTIVEAAKIVEQSNFVCPPIVGVWEEGGAIWMPEIPGINMREALREGQTPDPVTLLDGLESLWSLPLESCKTRAFKLGGFYRRADRMLRHALRNDNEAIAVVDQITGKLDRFVKSWKPTAVAHNDFYDDQMILMPDGRVALVDFEEAGPGDPLLDVGNFLAHLRWASHTLRSKSGAHDKCYEAFKRLALERFGWDEQDLAMREAVCLFRLCTITVRRPKSDFRDRAMAALELTGSALP